MTTETIQYTYCFLGGALLTLVLLGLLAAACLPALDKWNKRFFISSFIVLILSIIAYFIDVLVYTNPSLALAETIVAFWETFLPSLLMPLLTGYILYSSGENRRHNLFLRSILVIWSVHFILLLITQYTKCIYDITPDNQFIRGPLYPVLIAPMVALIGVNLAGVIRRRHQLKRKHFIAILVYLIPLMIAMVFQMFVSVFPLIVAAVSLSALSMFGIIMADQVDQSKKQEREISDQRARITVLQMRPHFIYNTMMSIYYLCVQNPQKAQQVTLDFTTYLRKNFNAIAGDETIPFSEELEHTRAYLAVEQAQFEDNLFVEYDTPHTLFRLPPLTLQPIVENAVKHGMDPDSDEALHIYIKTVKTDKGNEIIVEDNGPGFQPSDDHEPHIALKNVRRRLEAIGGSLTVSSRAEGGTKVSIIVQN